MNAKQGTPLENGLVLDGRYKVGSPLPEAGAGAFSGVDQQTKNPVILCPLSEDEVSSFDRLVQTKHKNLASPIALAEGPSGPVAVSPAVAGETLAERIGKSGKLEAGEAVRVSLQLVDALSAVHKAGAVHGRTHPGAVVLEPEERDEPVLAFRGQAPLPYDSPTRSRDAGGDAHAATSLLLFMLTGKAPPAELPGTEDELAASGVQDPRLRAILARQLSAEPGSPEGIAPLKRGLTGWFVQSQGGDGPSSESVTSSVPPPLPSGAPPSARVVSRARTAAAARPRSRLPILAAGGVVLGLGTAWAASVFLLPAEPASSAAVSSAAAPSANSGPESIDLGEVPVSGESDAEAVMDDRLSACITNYLPKGSFATAPNFGWICEETHPKRAAQKLVRQLVKHAPPGPPSPAMTYFSRLGRFDKPALAVIRTGCCSEAEPLALGKPLEKCGDLGRLITTIGKQVVDGEDATDALDAYAKATHCEVAAGRGAQLGVYARPGDRKAFDDYIQELHQK